MKKRLAIVFCWVCLYGQAQLYSEYGEKDSIILLNTVEVVSELAPLIIEGFSTKCPRTIPRETDNKTYTEFLFHSKLVSILSCIVIDRKGSALVLAVFHGKIDTSIVYLNVTKGIPYIVYSTEKGPVFHLNEHSKPITSAVVKNELPILKQYAKIVERRRTGIFKFTNSQNSMLAKGHFKKGIPNKVWHHYYENGILKATYNLKKNRVSQFYPNGFLKSRISLTRDSLSVHEEFSDKVNKQLLSESQFKNNMELCHKLYTYYENGKIKKIQLFYSLDKTHEIIEYDEKGNKKITE